MNELKEEIINLKKQIIDSENEEFVLQKEKKLLSLTKIKKENENKKEMYELIKKINDANFVNGIKEENITILCNDYVMKLKCQDILKMCLINMKKLFKKISANLAEIEEMEDSSEKDSLKAVHEDFFLILRKSWKQKLK